MKKILLIALVLLSVFSSAQNNYNRVNSRYNYLGLAADAFNLPGVGTPALKTAQLIRAGAMVYDSTGGSRGVYVYTGSAWIKLYDTLMTVTSPNFYTTDGTTSGARAVNLGGNLTFSGHNTRSITFDSLNALTMSRNGQTRISFNSGNTSIFNSTGLGALVMSSGNTILSASGGIDLFAPLTDIKGNLAVLGLRDSIYIKPVNGDLRIYPLNHNFSPALTVLTLDTTDNRVYRTPVSDIAGGSTPTLQQVLTAGSTLLGSNTITGDPAANLTFTNNNAVRINTDPGGGAPYAEMLATTTDIAMVAYNGLVSSAIVFVPDSIILRPHLGKIHIDSLRSGYIDTTNHKPLARKITNGAAGGDIVQMNSWAQVSGGGGSGAWNDITDPTGTQALTFADAELTTWANGSNTETFHTTTSNSLTTGTVYSMPTSSLTSGNVLNIASTSTALAAGNELINLSMSGANATSSMTATGLRVSVANTGTSNINIGIHSTASAASSPNNYGAWFNPQIAIERGGATDASTNGIAFMSQSGSKVNGIGVDGTVDNSLQIVGGNASGGQAIKFYTNSNVSSAPTNQRMIIENDGDIGIGVTAPTSKLHTTAFATAYAAKTTTYPITADDHTIEATTGTFTTTLPTAIGITGRQYVITNSGTGVITLATTSSQTFINVTATPTTLTLNQFNTVIVVSNGANWLRISSL